MAQVAQDLTNQITLGNIFLGAPIINADVADGIELFPTAAAATGVTKGFGVGQNSYSKENGFSLGEALGAFAIIVAPMAAFLSTNSEAVEILKEMYNPLAPESGEEDASEEKQ